ncbi:GHKL domain-containing protein [Deferribacter autotrophicus]|uniref:histidine kinase n=1 Tax=Deferribacter autotrophicus TaxID=500465 RepID=A0A5A8F5M1_9BACT|nr:ATP-binding protein [Deferribacter autotrophicus]KAA0257147.1 GHKL domain-containing protein [Deferribacter autotrophicus]
MNKKFDIKMLYIPGGYLPFFLTVIGTAIVSYFHFNLPYKASVIHYTHYYFFYLIVIYGAVKFGILGGILFSMVLSSIYNFDVYLNLFRLPHYLIKPFIEVLMIYTVGLLTGVLSQKLYNENLKLKMLTEELQESLELLRKNTEEKLKMEREIAKSDRLRVLGQLSAGIAHEIRNPLAAIKTAANMLKNGKYKEETLQIIIKEIDRLNEFLERFLQYAKFGKRFNEKINIKIFIDEIMDFVKLINKDYPNVQVNTNIALNENVFIQGDLNYLKQAFINIFANSFEELKSVDKGQIDFSVKVEDGKIKFIIKDNGKGFENDNLEKVFEPFYTTKNDGTGLGLTITHKIIKEHGGSIIIENDNGAKITIELEVLENENSTN